MSRVVVAAMIGALLFGLLAGYLWWGRLSAPPADLAKELADVKARVAEQTQRADEAQERSAELEAELTKAMEALSQEREAKEALEEVLSEGRK